MASVLQPFDPGDRLRRRREAARRRRHRRRLAAGAFVLTLVVGAVVGGVLVARVGHGGTAALRAAAPGKAARDEPKRPEHVPVPKEIRGVHVTMDLAGAGKVPRYAALTRQGLNTVELDVKDESGHIGFPAQDLPLARKIGAAKLYYRPFETIEALHSHGIYVVGRVVSFEDRVLPRAIPQLAVHRADGSLWANQAGQMWLNPYDHRVWDYLVAVGETAARVGFDEVQFDYVRFPSDGDLASLTYPVSRAEPKSRTIAAFLRYAANKLHPLGVRVSADVFGLSASTDVGVGQTPRLLGRYLDTIYPMVYPSHFGAGWYGIADPNAAPGPTVANALADFNKQLRGRKARIVAWLQDFSLGRRYTLNDVQEQITAARQAHAHGFLLWNAGGVYRSQALAPAPAMR